MEYSEDGSYDQKPDVVIFIYGETPYAEGEGDITSLDFSPKNKNILKAMKKISKDGIPLISLFISGRPLIVDQELNFSDAFVSLWLPGTAVEGISDVIFTDNQNNIKYDFSGKLPFSWPSKNSNNPLNIKQKEYYPLYKFGYGLTSVSYTHLTLPTIAIV